MKIFEKAARVRKSVVLMELFMLEVSLTLSFTLHLEILTSALSLRSTFGSLVSEVGSFLN